MPRGQNQKAPVSIVIIQPASISHLCTFAASWYRKKLDTEDYELAKRKLADFRRDLERTEATKGNTSFARLLDDYVHTLGGSDSTKEKTRAVIEKLSKRGLASTPYRHAQSTTRK